MALRDKTLSCRRIAGCASLAWLAWLWSGTAAAEPESRLDPRLVADLPLEQLLSVPVSVASLRAESFVDAPSSVTVFTRREILDMGVRTVEELLNFVPGFRSVRTASRSYYAVGGRGRNNSQLSNDILFLIDGRRVNDDFSGSALIFNRFLAVGNVKQVEVVRGPGSALYGSNAFVGIVNIVTSQDLNEGYAALGDGGAEGYLALSGGRADYQASVFVSGLHDDGADYPNPSGVTDTISDPRKAFTAYGTFETDRFRLDGRHARFTVEEFWLYGIYPGDPDVNTYTGEDTSVTATWEVISGEGGDVNLSGGVRRIDNSGLSEPFPAPVMQGLYDRDPTSLVGVDPDNVAAFLGGSRTRFTEWHAAIDGTTTWGDRHELFAGLSFRRFAYDTIRNRNNYETVELIDRLILGNPTPITYYGEVVETAVFGPEGGDREVFGAYLQDRIAVTDDLLATLGLRFDHYSDVGSTTNPRAALVYRAAPETTLKVMYGEAFRAPTVAELDLVNNPVTIGNPDLEPEKIKTLELAWLQEFDRFHVTLTGYASRLEDPIVRLPSDNPEVDRRGSYTNGDPTRFGGVELEFGAQLGSDFFVRGAFSHTIDPIGDPQTLPSDTASLIFNHRAGRLNTNLNVTWRSEVETGNVAAEKLDAAEHVTLNLRYRLDWGTLVGTVYNLTDDDTGDYAQMTIPGGSPQRERTFRVGLEIPL